MDCEKRMPAVSSSLYHKLAYALLPYTRRELPGWGRLFRAAGLLRDNWWSGTGSRQITGKLHGYQMVLNLDNWSDRHTYFVGRYYDLASQLLLQKSLRSGD